MSQAVEPGPFDWVQLASGKQFFPTAPEAEDFTTEDIAHALGQLTRFGGHGQQFYSVAEHSIHVSNLVPPQFALAALLHDAHEALLGCDVPRPVKLLPFMQGYRNMERRIQFVIAEKFQVSAASNEVSHADNLMCSTEALVLMPKRPAPWQALPEPIKDFPFRFYAPEDAKYAFLERLYAITGVFDVTQSAEGVGAPDFEGDR